MGSTRGTNQDQLWKILTSNTQHSNPEYNFLRDNLQVVGVITNRHDAEILERARGYRIPAYYHPSPAVKSETSSQQYERELLPILQQWDPDYIFLAGYMRKITSVLLDRYPIFNIHPSLLPRHGGLMDLAVHRSVLEHHDAQTGCTIHRIDSDYDTGPIIYQAQINPEILADPSLTPTLLKTHVQATEAQAWIEFSIYLAHGHLQDWLQPEASYQSSGVSVSDNDNWVETLQKATNRAITGDFCAVVSQQQPFIAAATDGVGTKLLLADTPTHYYNLGIDLVAMCVNDLAVRDCHPQYFLDYLAVDSLKTTTTLRQKFIEGIMEGCRQANKCQLIGGETAELSDLYPPGHWDAAGFALGSAAEIIHPTSPPQNSLIVGVPSNGIHANGFSLVRKILRRYRSPFTLDQWLAPTCIYYDQIQKIKSLFPEVVAQGHLAHITGGGLIGNLQRLFDPSTQSSYKISPANFSGLPLSKFPEIFQWLAAHGPVSYPEMLNTFDCGYGLVYCLPPEDKERIPLNHCVLGKI